MKEASPKKGDWSDDPTGRNCCRRQDRPVGHLGGSGCVRTGSSCAEAIDSNATSSTADSVSDRPVPTTHDCNNQHTKPDAQPANASLLATARHARTVSLTDAARTDGSRGVLSQLYFLYWQFVG